jgi:arylformamidase
MKKIIDITLMVTPDMPVWPGDPNVILERVSKIEEGSNANVSRMAMSVHTGTHMDAPYHFVPEGKTIETLPLEVLIGTAQVVELPSTCNLITASIIKEAGIGAGVERVLFKTRNSSYWLQTNLPFQTGFVGVSVDGAELLVSSGIRLVGIDYLSIAPFKQSRPTHVALLKAGMVILEGVDLSKDRMGLRQGQFWSRKKIDDLWFCLFWDKKCVPAIYNDHLAPDHLRLRCTKKRHNPRDIFRCYQSTRRCIHNRIWNNRRITECGEMQQRISLDNSRGNRVYDDIFRAEFDGCVADERFKRSFAGAYCHIIRHYPV